MQFDLYIPTLSLALEYNGKHHYIHATFFGEYTLNDDEKRRACKEAGIVTSLIHLTLLLTGITLIEVPYWWDMSSGECW